MSQLCCTTLSCASVSLSENQQYPMAVECQVSDNCHISICHGQGWAGDLGLGSQRFWLTCILSPGSLFCLQGRHLPWDPSLTSCPVTGTCGSWESEAS